jgi:3'(2'), 5'-bisphosphate nucleotidase
MVYQKELAAALVAARRAGVFLSEAYDRFQQISDAPSDITTDADRACQELILATLQDLFPEDAYCAEEDTPRIRSAHRTGPRTWIIDPIDGTRGFARKNGEFSVMIAIRADSETQVGVVLEPARGRLTYALRGNGCWCLDDAAGQPRACRVSQTAQLAEAVLTQSHAKMPGNLTGRVKNLAPARVIESYSAGIKLAQVARGEADLYVNTYLAFSDWDICAGHILVDEAGGQVTGLRGEVLEYRGVPGAQQVGLLASNGLLHAEAVSRLRDGGARKDK